MSIVSPSIQATFNGTEFFQRAESTHVSILEHALVGVFEVILYDPISNIEAPRVYIDKIELRSKIESQVSATNLSFSTCVVDKSVAEYALSCIQNNNEKSEKLVDSVFRHKTNGLVPFIDQHHKLLM